MSETTTIRVSRDVYNMVKALAQQQNENIQEVVEHAVAEYKKRKFFDNLNDAYARLKSDPEAWAEELEERDIWDQTAVDGLEKEDESK